MARHPGGVSDGNAFYGLWVGDEEKTFWDFYKSRDRGSEAEDHSFMQEAQDDGIGHTQVQESEPAAVQAGFGVAQRDVRACYGTKYNCRHSCIVACSLDVHR